ncbi:PEP/pyruvate-binding domain-containing protein [Tessaracoccus caeni]|uniref:PEP/pyruvate-binding domain-containing protein n=1 Tax=Tessaracoccus caeni TaxID=3031239 RepID=UPI0023D9AF90|nr:PEP/pyruvate-binding domain-containing protein [Tessaracoccus caeni]MDF1488903.1 PEP/pyruvate-binding domain-containing protein [Tessaracoccus caeni]
MNAQRQPSTGIAGLDQTIEELRLGDNVVWQVDLASDFATVVEPFIAQAKQDGRRIVHVRFGIREPWLEHHDDIETRIIDPTVGFESFSVEVLSLLTEVGRFSYYVFDPLTDLHEAWNSDLMVMNFFQITCPPLFELDTIAYFALLRHEHTFATIAGIRQTTQLLLDLHRIDDELYVQPLKVWRRHSPTMFFPHLLTGGDAISITSSALTARLFTSVTRRVDNPDRWERQVDEAWAAVAGSQAEQERARDDLLGMLVGHQGRMTELCRTYMNLTDLLVVASRMIGTGRIGGKAVGMLLARSMLEHDEHNRFSGRLEPHDSFFVGSDVFVSFLIGNGWWNLWTAHKQEGYFAAASELHEKIPQGRFPQRIREEFLQLMEYFGSSPIIVRSSSLLEDDYGNAFAGKYESVFLANQGDPDTRLQAFEDAVRTVYASAVGVDALRYRADRGLGEHDEQMAVLVQRVSGDLFGELFFPSVAGVANSSSLYVWDSTLPDRGMARLVVGLGTRAVDRKGGDFARIVALAEPSASPGGQDDAGKYSQRRVDVLDLAGDTIETVPMAVVRQAAARLDWSLLASRDVAAERRLRERGRPAPKQPMEVIDFAGLLSGDLPQLMADMLECLAEAYAHPVDTEFTINFDRYGQPTLNLVQCRPLQTRGVGRSVELPVFDAQRCLIKTTGSFMGGNAQLPLDLVVAVRPDAYLALGEWARYEVARMIGKVNRRLAGRSALLMGPGRWGTTTASLGVPAHFVDINKFAVLCEHTYAAGSFRPELSYGSHFFQELVEADTFYLAVFDGREGTHFNPDRVLDQPNLLAEIVPEAESLAGVLHVADANGLTLYADIVNQQLLIQ